jgi:hypothetical protein
MSDHHIQLWMLIVQIVALSGLALYVLETWKLRKASQEQVRISQDLIETAMEQVEGLSKPCLTLWADLRDQKDAMLEVGDIRGSTKARDDHGDFFVQNVVNGFAMNVSYRFVAVSDITARARHERYIQSILAGAKVTLVEPISAYSGTWNLVLHYESIGGRKYETKIRIDNLVLTNFLFKETERVKSI